MYENEIYSSSYNNNGGSNNGGSADGSNSGGNAYSGSAGDSNSGGNAYSSSAGDSNNNGSTYNGGSAYSSSNAGGSAYSVHSNNNSSSGGSPYFDYTAYPTSSAAPVAAEKKKKEKKAKKPRKPMSGIGKVALSAGMGLCFGLFAGAGFYGMKLGTDYFSKTEDTNIQPSTVQQPANNEAPDRDALVNAMLDDRAQLLQAGSFSYVTSDVSEVVADVMPAMVTIVNTYTVTGTSIWGQTYSQQQQGGGSGIIVAENDSELLIVTNNHVVEGADDLQVTFSDSSTAKASIKGLDADMDLAVIAVNLKDISSETRGAITIATLGDSEALKLGEPVIAIGNALGYGQSVTGGMVSALNREMTMEDGSIGVFIQTDAAINEGNSGGALLNIKGEVVGINSSKIGGSKVDNVGFAIPISSASPIISELMERKTRVKVAEDDKGYLGIEMLSQEVPEDIMMLYGMPSGVYIAKVQEGCAAEKAGIIQRDIVVKIDGVKVTTRAELRKEMEYHAAGDKVTVTIKRLENGEYATYDIEVTLGKTPKD